MLSNTVTKPEPESVRLSATTPAALHVVLPAQTPES